MGSKSLCCKCCLLQAKIQNLHNSYYTTFVILIHSLQFDRLQHRNTNLGNLMHTFSQLLTIPNLLQLHHPFVLGKLPELRRPSTRRDSTHRRNWGSMHLLEGPALVQE
jgi:hypothetical protein